MTQTSSLLGQLTQIYERGQLILKGEVWFFYWCSFKGKLEWTIIDWYGTLIESNEIKFVVFGNTSWKCLFGIMWVLVFWNTSTSSQVSNCLMA